MKAAEIAVAVVLVPLWIWFGKKIVDNVNAENDPVDPGLAFGFAMILILILGLVAHVLGFLTFS